MENTKNFILILIIITVALADMATDIYTPGLPKIGEFFKVGHSTVQLTISFNLLALAISGLVYGPLSDYYGRKPVILVGMTIFTIASVLCCFVNDIIQLIMMRFIQGIGAGVAGVVGYAAVKDMYSGTQCAKALSKLNMAVAFSPAVAPILGSTIIAYGYDWHTLFIIISVIAVMVIVLLFTKMEETIQNNILVREFSLISMIKQYVQIFRNLRFIGFALIHSLTLMWIWSYIGNLSFILTEGMGVSIAYYGYFVTMSVTSYTIGTIINQRLVEKVGMSRMLIIGLFLGFIPDVVVIILYYTINLTALIAEIVWIPSSIGLALIISNNMTSALESIKETGLGTAFMMCMQTTFGALGIYISGYFYNGTLLVTSVMTIVCSVIAIIIYAIINISDNVKLVKKF